MADFLIAHKKLSINEGGYANDPKDKGGETWKGIARNFHSDWEGWKIIDEYKRKQGFPGNLKKDKRLPDMELTFYKKRFWNVIRGDEISSQEIANMIYDDAVNTNCPPAIKKAQIVAFGLIGTNSEKKEAAKSLGIVYGRMDNKTLNKINNSL